MVDFGSRISSFAKHEAQSFVQKEINKVSSKLSRLGGGVVNSLVGSVASGLSQNLFEIGNSFNTIEAVAARKLDGIVAGGEPEFAAGGKCSDRSTAADISTRRNPGGGSLKSYLTDVFPESVIGEYNNEKNAEGDHLVLTESSNKYYLRLRFYPYERTDLFGPPPKENKYSVILPLPIELSDPTRVNYKTADMGVVGNLMNPSASLEGTGSAAALEGGGAIVSTLGNAVMNRVPGGGLVSRVAGDAGLNTENLMNAVEQYFGVAPNPNPSVLFKGPTLREFTFSWMFNPRNAEESRRLKSTIQKMKASALPTTAFGSDTGLLKYPHVVMLNFYPWDSGPDVSDGYGWTDQSFLRFKRCVISSITPDYAPTGAPAWFAGTNDPMFVRLNINFSEIEFFVSGDWGGEKEGGSLSESFTKYFETFRDTVGLGESQ